MTDPRLPGLRAVAEVLRLHAAAALAANIRAEAALADEARALRDRTSGTDLDSFSLAGGDAPWRRWRSARLTALNGERAKLRMAREGLAQAHAQATARVQALDRLIDD